MHFGEYYHLTLTHFKMELLLFQNLNRSVSVVSNTEGDLFI